MDGHRGLAILLVIFFHAFARWPELVPYGNLYGDVPIFKFGWIGVQLFFLISGFVILMTLEKCTGIKEFMFRRWIRLFPAMLVCSTVIYATSSFFPERPAGKPSITSLLPGLTFIEPLWWKSILGLTYHSLEESFWSLYAEFKFYVFAAFLYYYRGRNWLISSLILVYLTSLFFRAGNSYFHGSNPLFLIANNICGSLSFEYFGWFAGGAMFYVYVKESKGKWFWAALGISALSATFIQGLKWQPSLACILVAVFFAISLITPGIQLILSSRFFTFLGFISYPLYLIHENMMIAMIIKIGKAPVSFPAYVYPLLPILLLAFTAYVLTTFAEAYTKQGIVKCIQAVTQRIHSSPGQTDGNLRF